MLHTVTMKYLERLNLAVIWSMYVLPLLFAYAIHVNKRSSLSRTYFVVYIVNYCTLFMQFVVITVSAFAVDSGQV